MKRLLNITLILAFGLCLLGIGIRASAEEAEEYTVYFEDAEYRLYSEGADFASPILRTGSLGELLEYIYALTPMASIRFSGVITAESIYLKSGEYTFSGELEFLDGAGITVDGGKMLLSSADIRLNTGNIRIKRGSLEMYSGSITSSAENAILLDYSSVAAFSLFDGKITTQSENASIMLKYGRLTVAGGTVENSAGVAISSASTLELSGTPVIAGVDYGIETSVPLTLSDGVSEYSGSVRVKFLDKFEKGSIACVAYMASAQSLSGISLFDRNGSLQELQYFSSYNGIEEFDFGAVYSPYTIEFKDNGQLLFSQYLLRGEKVSLPDSPIKDGYKFVGWRYSSETGEFYEFSAPVENDITLHASYELEKPKYELKSLSFVYDKVERRLKFSEISHPLLSEGVLSYSWYKDGEAIQNFSDGVNIKNVSDSGEYYCTITFTLAGESVSLDTVRVEVRVLRAEVELPEIASVPYNGKYQYPDISSNGVYTVEDTGGVLVGIYPIRITLTDCENYRFSDSDAESVYLDFVIEKAENRWSEELTVYDIYSGMTPSPSAIPLFGDVEFSYCAEEDGEYCSTVPNVPGIYYVKACVEDNENYYALESAPVKFAVIEEIAVGISVIELPKKMEYCAFEYFDPNGISVGVTYNSGRSVFFGAESLEFFYQTEESFRYGDNSVSVSYGGVSTVLRVTVKKAEYDISGLIFEDTAVEYDSNYKTIEISGVLPVGLDGVPLTAVAEGGSKEAGRYTVTLIFSTESQNYLVPENMYATLTVTPKVTEIIWERTSFVYDGAVKTPTAYYKDVHGRKIELSVSGGRSYAGKYTALASGSDPNYSFLNPSVHFTVEKADYDMSKVVWIGEKQYYDGSEKRVTLSNLPEGVSVVGYLDNKAVDAGEYLATASLGYDEHNYNPPSPVSCVWFVLPATYDTDGFRFVDAEYVYDGEPHYPTLNGEMPVGVDGVALLFEYGEGIVNVSEGRAAVEIIFSTESKNYLPPQNMIAYVEILPKEITVSWHSLEFTYDGERHTPYAMAEETEIYVSGGAVGAGVYTARASSTDGNYSVINSEAEFVINKAQNRWLSSLTVEDIFYGRKPKPYAEALCGEVVYVYYADAGAREEIEVPNEVGMYFVKAVGNGDGNYLPIESQCLPFSIIAIVPIGISIELESKEYTAFDLILPENFTAYLNNNDGSVVLLDGEELTVVYTSGDSLRASDKTVGFVYRDFVTEKEVSVKKRDYDLSGVVWQNLLHIYDGGEKSARISGLPEGVTVISYEGNGVIFAGEYTVRATLDYDKENYNEPKAPDATLIVEKQIVWLEGFDAAVYNGEALMPAIAESELFSYEFSAVRDAGAYEVFFFISDPLNYAFTNGEDTISLPFFVEKRKLTVKVCDVTLYLFEKDILTSYLITEGELVSGDTLLPSYHIGEDEINASFASSNYDIEVIPGRIDRVKTLSQESLKLFLIILFALLAGTVALVAVILNRKRLYRYYRAALCRTAALDNEAVFEDIAVDTVTAEEVLEDVPEEALSEKTESEDALFEEIEGQEILAYCETENEEEEPSESLNENTDGYTSFAPMINADYADSAITDSLARDLIRKDEGTVVTEGNKKGIINVDTLSRSFASGERVDVNLLKEKSLVPYDTAYIKVLARGVIDKPLTVCANDFSLSAVKMIALAGGKSVKVVTVTKNKGRRR